MINRLLEFYQESKLHGPLRVAECWDTQIKGNLKPILAALDGGNAEQVKFLLDNCIALSSFSIEHSTTPWNCAPMKTHLCDLYHLLGIVPAFNPEQPFINNHTPENPLDHLAAAESVLGLPLRMVPLFGFDSEKGIPYRYLFYAAAAHVIVSQLGRKPNRILELGAGFGDLGFIATRWESESYTVIDLPQTAVLSAYFLSHCVNESLIWLHGEPEKPAFGRFYISNEFSGVYKRQYDLIFNSDSLPEMTATSQDEYLYLFHRVLSDDGLFVSINQEACNNGQSRVYDAVKRHGGFHQVARFPFLMRAGYMVEIFKKKQPQF